MDYRALAATDVWEQETAAASGQPSEVLAVISDSSLLAEVRKEFESVDERFSIKQVASYELAKAYCQNNAVFCVLLADPLLRNEKHQTVTDNILELRLISGSLSLPVVVLSDGASAQVRAEFSDMQSCDAHELSDTGVHGLSERVCRLMWRIEVEEAITGNQLRRELLSLTGSRYEEGFVARVESMVSALQKPLEAVQVFTSVALDESPHSEIDPQDNPLILAKDSSETLEHQIDALQECIRNHSRRAAQPQDSIRLRDLFAIVMRVNDIDARPATIDLEIVNNPNLPALQCNAVHLSQMLVQILSFGCQYVGAGGKIRLATLAGRTKGCQTVTVKLLPKSQAEQILFDLTVPDQSKQAHQNETSASLAGDFDITDESSEDFEIRVSRQSSSDATNVKDLSEFRSTDVSTTTEGGCA